MACAAINVALSLFAQEDPAGSATMYRRGPVPPVAVTFCPTTRRANTVERINGRQRNDMVFYLFRARGGVNGIPMPSSAHYRLWIQPRPRHQAGTSGHPQTQTHRQHRPKFPRASRRAEPRGKPEKEESPFVWAFLTQKGGIF